MKVRYQFVTGEVSDVEVSAELADVLLDLERQEYNNEHKETRRHVSLNMVMEDQGMQFADPTSQSIPAVNVVLRGALDAMNPEQRKLIQAVFIDGVSVNEYARREGVHQSTISHRHSVIYKKICKDLARFHI